MVKVIYQSEKSAFAIGCDELQWILWEGKRPSGQWNNTSYFSNITSLLDDLAETMFRKWAKPVHELKELDATVARVYELIEEVTGEWSFKGKSGAIIDQWRASKAKGDER